MFSGITNSAFQPSKFQLPGDAMAFLDGNVELIEDLVVQVSTTSKIHDQPTPVLLVKSLGAKHTESKNNHRVDQSL